MYVVAYAYIGTMRLLGRGGFLHVRIGSGGILCPYSSLYCSPCYCENFIISNPEVKINIEPGLVQKCL